jgi:hypothetical protein
MSKLRRLAVLPVAGLGSACIAFFGALLGCHFFYPIPSIYFSEQLQLQLSLRPYAARYISVSTLVAVLSMAVVVVYLRRRLDRMG